MSTRTKNENFGTPGKYGAQQSLLMGSLRIAVLFVFLGSKAVVTNKEVIAKHLGALQKKKEERKTTHLGTTAKLTGDTKYHKLLRHLSPVVLLIENAW